jgi:hypothetical protein
MTLACSVAKMNRPVERKLAMEMVDQPLDSRLTVLQDGQARADGIAKLALDDRVHRFRFRLCLLSALTKQAV